MITKINMTSINQYLLYNFKNDSILKAALTHPSIHMINDENYLTYEKLEFLGDTVLCLIMSEYLVNKYKSEKEGLIAKRRSYLVSGKILVEVANKINLANFILMSPGEELSGGRLNKNNLENCLESVIGAMYIDGGLEICRNFIYKYWIPISERNLDPPSDSKTTLQELVQKLGKPIPKYETIEISGPAHKPEFTIEITINNEITAQAKGSNKKNAEQNAAEILLKKIQTNV